MAVKITQIESMTTIERDALINSPSGTIVFNETDGEHQTTNDNGATWVAVGDLQSTNNLSDVSDKEITCRNIGFTVGDEQNTGDSVVYNENDQVRYLRIDSTSPGQTITLCEFNGTRPPKLGDVFFRCENNGVDDVQVLRAGGALSATVKPGEIYDFIGQNNNLAGNVRGFIVGDLQSSNNLSDVDSKDASCRNIGLTVGSQVNPIGPSNIVFTQDDQVRYLRIDSTALGQTVRLCEFNGTRPPKLGDVFFRFENNGVHDVDILTADGFIISLVKPGQVYDFIGQDNTVGGNVRGFSIGDLQSTNNLSDVSDKETTCRNIGLTVDSVTDNTGSNIVYTEDNQVRYLRLPQTAPGQTVTLCPFDGSSAPKVGDVFFRLENNGNDDVQVFNANSVLVNTVKPGEIYDFIAESNAIGGQVRGFSYVESVNGLIGQITVDGSNIDTNHTPINYTSASANLDDNFAGIDTVLGPGGLGSTINQAMCTEARGVSTAWGDLVWADIVDTYAGSPTFPANSINSGDILEVNASGYLKGTNGSEIGLFRLRFGGIVGTSVASIFSTNGELYFEINFKATVGSSGPITARDIFFCAGGRVYDDQNTDDQDISFDVPSSPITNDLTSAQDMKIEFETTSGASFQCLASAVTLIKRSF